MNKIFFSFFNEDNINNIVNGLQGKKEYICTIPYPDNISELLISRVISLFLEDFSKERMQQPIIIIINELIHNANRINSLTSFFKENNLDITNEDDFKNGRKQLVDGKYHSKYKNKNHYIKIEIRVNNRELYISIENDRKLTEFEIQEYDKLLEYSDKFKTVEQLFYDNPNITNRVDFGLILTILMLKQMNIDKNAIIFSTSESTTTTELTFPFLQLSEKKLDIITDKIALEIKSLPQLPASIIRLQKEIMDPEWDYEHITDSILSEPALTVEILRLVNSPVYKVGEKIDKVSLAVKKIGINGLKAILYDFGSMKILESRYDIKMIAQYREHLFQVALISSYIAKFNNFDNFAEDIYVAALMHDIGKIIIQYINNDLVETLTNFCSSRKIPLDTIDKLSDGYNHAIVGARLAKKWSFPDKYVNSIRYHHLPHQVAPEYRIMTYCVYLGNEITQILEGKSKYSNINSNVLKFFKMNTKESFYLFIKQIKSEGLIL